jgi:hypothetical protein
MVANNFKNIWRKRMRRTALPCSTGCKQLLTKYAMTLIVFIGLIGSAGAVDLNDNFERPDSSSLGNGWIEKLTGGFVLANGQAVKQSASTGYRDNVVYRPASEDLLDQEASIELSWLNGSIGYPQVFVRLQSDTATGDGILDGYILYVNNSTTEAILGRQRGGQFVVPLATLNFSTPLNTTDVFRLRLRAIGTSPVELSAWVEQFVGGSWQVIGQANASDSNGNRIATAGAVGFGGYVENTYSYDNFQRLDLDGGGGTPDNPVPVSGTVTPDSALAGSGNLTITVTGTDFVSASVVRWNGSNRATTYVSPTQLNADITAADLAVAGTANVTVFNPTPGGGISAPLTFTINESTSNPIPQTTTIIPASATEGGSAFLMTVNGIGFVPGSVVRWNGTDRATTFVSDTELQATIPDTDIAFAGTAAVTVFTPAPGGGISNSQTFTIDSVVVNNPVPNLSAIAPANVTEGSPGFTLTVTGTDFVAGAIVRWNGSDRITTYISSTELQAAIDAADVASAGNADVSVFNPAPGGGLSNIQTLTIDPSGPTTTQSLNSVNPNSATVGDTSAVITVYGSGFTQSSVVRLAGSDLPTTFVSATQLSATIGSAFLANDSRPAVMVYTPEASNTLAGPVTFFVMQTGESLFTDDFNRPDGPDLGNGWTEKLPSAFSLQNGMVTSVDTIPRGFNDAITYRPTTQDADNVEVATEFVRTGNSERYPQVHSRVLRDNVDIEGELISYTAFLYDNYQEYLTITPIDGYEECYLAQFPLTEPTVVGDRYRIRFRTLGTGAEVRLTAYLDHFVVDRWETISAGTVVHDANSQPTPGYFCNLGYIPDPYTHSGAVGFAKYIYGTDSYDSFYSITLATDNNETPVATSLVPSSANAGSAGFPLTINGDGFVPGAIVRWNGNDRPTTYISRNRLEAQISAQDLLVAGSADVTVYNPPPGGGETAPPLVFTITSGGGDLFDNFNRPDSSTIGNGWLELTPNAFFITNGQVVKQPTGGTGYLMNLVYRPAAENVLDVNASVEFQILQTAASWRYPQLWARLQTTTLGYGYADGYILYVNDSGTELILGRQEQNYFVFPLSIMTLSQEITSGNNYRMSLQVTGTDPVDLQATVERQTATGWLVIGQASALDTSPNRHTTAGSVGFSGYIFDGYVYDNFLRTNLAP